MGIIKGLLWDVPTYIPRKIFGTVALPFKVMGAVAMGTALLLGSQWLDRHADWGSAGAESLEKTVGYLSTAECARQHGKSRCDTARAVLGEVSRDQPDSLDYQLADSVYAPVQRTYRWITSGDAEADAKSKYEEGKRAVETGKRTARKAQEAVEKAGGAAKAAGKAAKKAKKTADDLGLDLDLDF